MKVCIVGFGYLGAYIAKPFLRMSGDVLAIKRQMVSSEHQRLKILACDLDKSSFPSIEPPVKATIYCISPRSADEADYRQTYEYLLGKALNWHRSNVPDQPFVLVSSTGIYHQGHGETVQEDDSLHLTTARQKSLAQAESMVRSICQHFYIVRLAGIYGPKRLRMFQALNGGHPNTSAMQMYLNTVLNLIHVSDAAELIHHLLISQAPYGIYNGVDSHPSLRSTIRAWIQQHVPQLFASSLAPSPHSNSFSSKRSSLAANKICSNKKVLKTGFQFQYPDFRAGLISIMQDSTQGLRR